MTTERTTYLSYRDRDPVDYYQQLRAEDPVHWDPEMNAWLVTGFEDCAFIMRNEETFRHPYNDFESFPEGQGGPRSIFMLQGEEHERMHRYLFSFFSRPRLAEYREAIIEPLVDRLISRIVAAGGGELSSQLAWILPTQAIGVMLGMPLEDEELLEKIRHWNDDVMHLLETFGEDAEAVAVALDSSRKLNDLLLPVVRERQVRPQDDYISRLWESGPSILQPWTETEVLAQCRVLLFAGTETTSHALNNALYVWLTRDDLRSSLTVEDVPRFAEEVLRFPGVVHFRVRVARKDVELGGKVIRAGERVHTMNTAANLDGDRFPDPDTIQLDRRNARQHLTFGVGPRTCVGASLARLEVVETMKQVIERMPNARLDPSNGAPRLKGHMVRSFTPLHVTLQW
jgi:cytochrome P450